MSNITTQSAETSSIKTLEDAFDEMPLPNDPPVTSPIPAGMFSPPGNDDDDDEDFPTHTPDVMSGSYSEISFHGLGMASSSNVVNPHPPQRPASLAYEAAPPDDRLNRTAAATHRCDGPMTSFVADDLVDQIKLASPVQRTAADELCTPHIPSQQFLQQSHAAAQHQIDVTVISDVECECEYLAASVDTLTENLGDVLHSISVITAENVEVYRDSVTKLTDSMDANIKSMYTIMAKTEEITKLMRPAEPLAARM